MNGKEYKLLIKIGGKVEKSLSNSLKKSLKEIDSQLGTLDKGFDAIGRAGKAAFDLIISGATVAATAIGAATTAAIQVGSEFESAFAGVKKTVDATDEEFAQLREGIIGMTREIPASASEIAGVMEIAGQLGIANDSLLDFTETMINLGVSTNMSAEDAATALAKFANIVNMDDFGKDGVSNWDRLGSTVVDLGNKFATTEEDIVNMSMRLAAAGHLAGLSEADILALSTAMSSVGIRAEAGGSSMSKLIKTIQVAVENGSESLEDYAKVANMSTEEFATAFKTNAVGALDAFISGLNDTERNGKSAIGVLSDMGLKEIRLSNMILALAGSEGVMTEALQVANEAWGENVALSEEARKRYETVESQATLVKNAFQELGIQAYDEMRPYIVDALSEVKDVLHDLIDSGAIRKLIKDVTSKLPTVKRVFETNVGAVIDKCKSFGSLVIKNGDKIVGVISGIAAAFAAFKIAKTTVDGLSFIMTFFSSLGSLNPVTGVIMGVVAAVGLLAGEMAAIKVEEERLKAVSLDEHFGNLELGIKDVKEAAEALAGGNYFKGIREAFSELEKLDNYTAGIENAQETIDKLNFKVSLGIKLDEDDQASYKTAIDQYISEVQGYVTQQQYAINVAVKTSFTEDQLEDTNVISVLNTFYSNQQTELAGIGNKLRDTVNDAFTDGLLDIDEVKEIQELQAQMAKLQEEITKYKSGAKLDILGEDFKASDLSSDAFSNIRAEAAATIQENAAASKEVITQTVADINAAYQAQYDAAFGGARKKQIQREWDDALSAVYENNAANNEKATLDLFNFDMSAITGAYDAEVSPTLDTIRENTQQKMRDMFDVEAALQGQEIPWGQIIHQLYYDMEDELQGVLGTGDKAAVKSLLQEMEPDAAQTEQLMQSYRDVGKQIPEELIQSMLEYKTLKVMAGEGTEEDLWSIVGEAVANDEQLSELVGKLNEKGAQVPEEINQSIIDNAGVVESGVSELYNTTGNFLDEYFSNPFDVTAKVNVEFEVNQGDFSVDVPSSVNAGTAGGTTNASGGIINFKTLSWLAEDGPEAVIPLDGSDNAMSLWAQAGKLLGIGKDDNSVATANAKLETFDTGQTMEITYSPQYVFNGEAPSKQDMVDAAAISQKQFDAMMQEWQKKNRRTRFAS